MTLRYNYTKKTGRPTKYDPSFVDKVDKYIESTGKEQTSLPTIEGFAIYLDVSRDSLYEWAKQYVDFSDTLRRIEIRQKQQLIDDGIYGGKEVNATIVKLLLQNNHGMKERSDTTSDDKPLKIPETLYVKFIDDKTNDNKDTS